MTELRYTVTVWDDTFNEWCDLAAFRWFTDARNYALRCSANDKLGRVIRVRHRDGTRDNLYQHGRAAYDLEDCEPVAEVPVTIPLDPRPLPIEEGWA